MRRTLGALLLAVACGAPAQTAALRWAGDSEGGAPFIFQSASSVSQTIGCEVELMQAISDKLHRKSHFIQNSWDGLIPGLKRGNYEVAVNAIEITADRAEVVNFSLPYYVTYEQLMVREETYDIHALKDCQAKNVGTYRGSLAQRILEAHGGIQVKLYDDVEPMYRDLLYKRLDATLLDYPLALYCGKPLSGLKFVGAPVSRMEYGIALRKEDRALLGQVNQALRELKAEGRLREIFERWNLWTPMMADWTGDTREGVSSPSSWEAYLASRAGLSGWSARARAYLGYLPLLAKGALVTLGLSLSGMLLAMALGLGLTLTRLYGPKFFSACAVVYIELFRGTPLLIQLFILYYGLPYFGIKFPPFAAAVLGLGLNYAAYEAENYRAGLMAVPRGQMEAAHALGYTQAQALRHILLPQALRFSLPPVTNDFISIIKDSSLVSVITMVELTKVYGQLASATYDWLGLGLLTAGMYFLVGWPFVLLARKAERKFNPLFKPF
jgi:polar amino acid transport system substrate-binding protein